MVRPHRSGRCALSQIVEKPSEAVPRAGSALATQIRALPPAEAAAVLERVQPAEAVEALLELNPAIVQNILHGLDKAFTVESIAIVFLVILAVITFVISSVLETFGFSEATRNAVVRSTATVLGGV